jgi:hypothetical protein
MIQRLLEWILSIAKRWVDDTVTEEELHAFLRNELFELTKSFRGDGVPENELQVSRILTAADRLSNQGFPDLAAIDTSPEFISQEGTEINDEMTEYVVRQGRITQGAVDTLMLAIGQRTVLNAWQEEQMEALLRHIEVRRQAALRFEQTMSREERWLAVTHISLLFNRFAKREHDYRFLNAALKLNDWAYRYYRNRRNTLGRLFFLQAALEAEATLQEMTA